MKSERKCPVIVICICFALWFLLIPLIFGIYFYIKNIQIEKKAKIDATDEISKLKSDIEKYTAKKDKIESEYNEAVHKKDTLLYQYREEAKSEAEQEIQNKLDLCRESLKQLEQDISVKELTLADLKTEYDKTQKILKQTPIKCLNSKRFIKAFNMQLRLMKAVRDLYLMKLYCQCQMKLYCRSLK